MMWLIGSSMVLDDSIIRLKLSIGSSMSPDWTQAYCWMHWTSEAEYSSTRVQDIYVIHAFLLMCAPWCSWAMTSNPNLLDGMFRHFTITSSFFWQTILLSASGRDSVSQACVNGDNASCATARDDLPWSTLLFATGTVSAMVLSASARRVVTVYTAIIFLSFLRLIFLILALQSRPVLWSYTSSLYKNASNCSSPHIAPPDRSAPFIFLGLKAIVTIIKSIFTLFILVFITLLVIHSRRFFKAR